MNESYPLPSSSPSRLPSLTPAHFSCRPSHPPTPLLFCVIPPLAHIPLTLSFLLTTAAAASLPSFFSFLPSFVSGCRRISTQSKLSRTSPCPANPPLPLSQPLSSLPGLVVGARVERAVPYPVARIGGGEGITPRRN